VALYHQKIPALRYVVMQELWTWDLLLTIVTMGISDQMMGAVPLARQKQVSLVPVDHQHGETHARRFVETGWISGIYLVTMET
jgi:hypothetical protein